MYFGVSVFVDELDVHCEKQNQGICPGSIWWVCVD